MGRKEKLIARMRSIPADMTFDELEQLLRFFGYARSNKGKTSGSRVAFVRQGMPPILLHRPHGRKCLWKEQVRAVLALLEEEGML